MLVRENMSSSCTSDDPLKIAPMRLSACVNAARRAAEICGPFFTEAIDWNSSKTSTTAWLVSSRICVSRLSSTSAGRSGVWRLGGSPRSMLAPISPSFFTAVLPVRRTPRGFTVSPSRAFCSA